MAEEEEKEGEEAAAAEEEEETEAAAFILRENVCVRNRYVMYKSEIKCIDVCNKV